MLFLQNNWQNQLDRDYFSSLQEQSIIHILIKKKKKQKVTYNPTHKKGQHTAFFFLFLQQILYFIMLTTDKIGKQYYPYLLAGKGAAPALAKSAEKTMHREMPFISSLWMSDKHTALLSSTEDQDITARLALGSGLTICFLGLKS